jgi:hypothetical protein
MFARIDVSVNLLSLVFLTCTVSQMFLTWSLTLKLGAGGHKARPYSRICEPER